MVDEVNVSSLPTGDFHEFERFLLRRLAAIGCYTTPFNELSTGPDDSESGLVSKLRIIGHLEALKRHLKLLNKDTYVSTTNKIAKKLSDHEPTQGTSPRRTHFGGASLKINGDLTFEFDDLPDLQNQMQTIDNYIIQIKEFS